MYNMIDENATCHPSSRRVPMEALHVARERLLLEELIPLLLEAMPLCGLILNEERQVLAANGRLLDTFRIADPNALLGRRPGEVISCLYSGEGHDGCGTGQHCAGCGAVMAIVESQQQNAASTRECRITVDTNGGSCLDLEVTATPIHVADMRLTVLAMRDISAEKRRSVLERVFFHDIINTAGGVRGLAEVLARGDILTPQQEGEYRHWMVDMAHQLVDEITHQQQLLAAEKGSFRPTLKVLSVTDLLRDVWTMYANHEIATGRSLVLGTSPEGHIVSDGAILRRILGNMVKNALEATDQGGVVTIAAEAAADTLTFCVHNPGVIPQETQMQIFQRSFSTKAEEGRGIGTYSIKLFGERYLGGKVHFSSREPDGTTFCLTLPRELSPPP